MVKFFAKGPQGVSLGSDASIFKDLSVYPPEKVTISMLITAQVIIMYESTLAVEILNILTSGVYSERTRR